MVMPVREDVEDLQFGHQLVEIVRKQRTLVGVRVLDEEGIVAHFLVIGTIVTGIQARIGPPRYPMKSWTIKNRVSLHVHSVPIVQGPPSVSFSAC